MSQSISEFSDVVFFIRYKNLGKTLSKQTLKVCKILITKVTSKPMFLVLLLNYII